jgi:hypothetical protein
VIGIVKTKEAKEKGSLRKNERQKKSMAGAMLKRFTALSGHRSRVKYRQLIV